VVSCNNSVIPRGEALSAIASADYLLLIDIGGDAESVQVPAKVFDYVRAGRPILGITRAGSPVDRILLQCGIPYARIGPDDTPAEVDEKFLAFLQQAPGTYPPSDWFYRQFDGRKQTHTLASILDRFQSRRNLVSL
jgi:hypothetical protein